MRQQAQIQAQYDIAGQQRWTDIFGLVGEYVAAPMIKESLVPWVQGLFNGDQLGSRPGATSAWAQMR